MLTQSDLGQEITNEVRHLYEAFPYPHYPLLAKPRWQEGYIASSLLQARLAGDLLGHPLSVLLGDGHSREVLVAGSGEMQPYVIGRLEPSHHNINCVDLSETSLKRARIRTLASRPSMRFHAADIAKYLQGKAPESLDHAEAFGVLHHLADPQQVCELLYSRLRPGGSLRLMVYNAQARQWIHQLQKVFRLLSLSPYQKSDLALARHLLQLASLYLPSLNWKLSCLSSHTLKHDTRLIDTFFHVRELTIKPERWVTMLRDSGFKTLSLFDRYGELDDLANPLWEPPTLAQLNERCRDGRFQNNLELVLYKPWRGAMGSPAPACPIPLGLRRSAPPLAWFEFHETKGVNLAQRYYLWHCHLAYVWQRQYPRGLQPMVSKLSLAALQRLARLGALLPGMIGSRALRHDLKAPMLQRLIAPEPFRTVRSASTPLKAFVEKALHAKQRYSGQRHELILSRLDRAQAEL